MANEILYGFVQLKDQLHTRALTVGADRINAAVELTLEEHNRRLEQFLGLFASPTENYSLSFKSMASARLQPMDEYGRPRPIKHSRYSVGFPLRMGAVGTGENFVVQAKMSVRDVNNLVSAALSADIRWMRDQMLAAIFANASYTFTDVDYGDVIIQGFANNDAVKYAYDNGNALAADTHYLGQAGTIADGAATNPFPIIYAELKEHPENDGDVVCFIPTNIKAAVEALTDFTEFGDPDITPGSNVSRLTGTLGIDHPGELIGKANGCWIVEWKSLPDNYIVATTSDGDDALLMRQDPEPELRGLILRGREDSPYSEQHWYRRAGFGANNRVRVLVFRIGNATYAVPTGYAQPLA